MGSPVSASAPEDHSCVQAFLQSEVAADLLEATTEPSRIFWKKHFGETETVTWTVFLKTFTASYPIPPEPEVRDIHVDPLKYRVADLLGAKGNQPESRVQAKLFEQFTRHFRPLDNQMWKRVYYLVSRNWFHGALCMPCADTRLERAVIGTFLVRFSSSTPGLWTVSYVTTATKNEPTKGISIGMHVICHERLEGDVQSVRRLIIERSELQKPYMDQEVESHILPFPRIPDLPSQPDLSSEVIEELSNEGHVL